MNIKQILVLESGFRLIMDRSNISEFKRDRPCEPKIKSNTVTSYQNFLKSCKGFERPYDNLRK